MDKLNFPFKKVMVIDDNYIDRYIAEMAIKTTSFAEQIILKDSVRGALAYLESLVNNPEALPEVIFLDIRMPEFTGFDFLDMYNGLPEVVQKKCIIMMLTSSLDSADMQRATENRFVNRYLNKPLTRNKLFELEAEKNHFLKEDYKAA